MSLSVGTIETYVPNSTEFTQTQYSDLGTQDRDSLTLSDSDLWLVDSTTLTALNTDNSSIYDVTSLYSDGEGYLAPMSSTNMESTTGKITVYSSDPSTDNILYTGDSSLQMSDGTPLLEVQGDTQSGSTLLSSIGDLRAGTTDGEFTLTGSDPMAFSSNSLGSLSLPAGDNTAEGNTAIEVNSILGSNIATSTDITDVPFEMHSALGLLVIGAITVVRHGNLWRRC
ncbi:hypothetical protein VB780_27840 [Leptolyngbya sp. CCNP1308]|uniref:hypothetical protein n=1 Tax=Leptolyngbya sp. CCNP1308 TaxID=3110255 RepID=UPI002B210064|nr:hypothetical protein [Leptolyngbya sp. CCNP1308]MEA5452417.1 hypothetical protein [Leptolyngbya sp. CCNP1308]